MEQKERGRTNYGRNQNQETGLRGERDWHSGNAQPSQSQPTGKNPLNHSKYRLHHENEYDQEHNYYDNFRSNQVKLGEIRKGYGISGNERSNGMVGSGGSSFGLGYGNGYSGHFVDNGGDY